MVENSTMAVSTQPFTTQFRLARDEAPGLIRLAIPLVAGLASATFLGLTDTYFIGATGDAALGAASLTNSVLIVFYAALYGFVGPVGLLAGNAFGADNPARIGAILQHGRVLGLAAGLFGALAMALGLFALPYIGQPEPVLAIIGPYWLLMGAMMVPYCLSLVYKQIYDAIDKPWTGVMLTLVAVLTNIPLTWAMVGGHLGFPALGLTGAGLSSLMSGWFGVAVTALHYRFTPAMARYRPSPGFSRNGFTEQTREGLPMATQYLFEGGAVAIAGVMIGWLGTTALAANQIVFSVGSVLYMIPLGMAAAVGIRIAQASGAGEHARLRAIGSTALGLVSLWTTTLTVVLVLGGATIARAFVDDPAIIALAGLMFLTTGVMQVCDGLQSVSLGALRGMLDNQWPTRVSLVAYWLVALPAAYLFAFLLGLGAPGVWAGFGVGLLIASTLLFRRFLSKTVPQP
jgi:multidrug resistance protein, MATE family